MRKLLAGILFAGVMALSVQNGYAAETKDVQGIYEECGLGGLIFPRWPVGASVSNVTWDLGTTAATSGLTTPDACKGGQAKLASYIYKSYDSIEKDLAKGDGKYLDMLALLSETTVDNKNAFIEDVRGKFRAAVEKKEYSTLSRLEKSKLVYSIVKAAA